ncbi:MULTISPECIES: type IV pilin-like G/H family protein [Nostoc]|uniref:Type IV pilin-like G/H family protein n=2 Tax=Nostoc TaxID=1177 RepID=A0ABR8IBS4_9NOSO|nr:MULTISPECIES: type IV pilin-like G/H family protein [Nostoc]MBD2563083.1 type IV pilin-like G/H family protein [Nostoc linckia FACHB-391]MBD2648168.1 type IV pilin-like G/H family protein [Nostoc foliaceum FACHB-393]
MKTELKAKFIQHILNKKKENEGFTLIELLVVIIIIGILSAIALPSFLNQANKAKQSEAKTITGSMNRAQQAYYLENGKFVFGTDDDSAAAFGSLGLGVKTQTENYKYGIVGGEKLVTNQAQLKTAGAPLKVYVGGVGVAVVSDTSEATTVALLCESKLPGNVTDAADGTETFVDANIPAAGGATSCPDKYDSLAK